MSAPKQPQRRRASTKRTALHPQHARPSTSQLPSGIISPWGRVDEEYALIKADLKRLLLITAVLLVLLAVLTVLLR